MRDYNIEEEKQGERQQFCEAFEKLQECLLDCMNTVDSLNNAFITKTLKYAESYIEDIECELKQG